MVDVGDEDVVTVSDRLTAAGTPQTEGTTVDGALVTGSGRAGTTTRPVVLHR